MYACRAVVSAVLYVYASRNYLSVFLRQSGVLPSADSHTAHQPLLGTFQPSNIGESHSKSFHVSSTYVDESSPLTCPARSTRQVKSSINNIYLVIYSVVIRPSVIEPTLQKQQPAIMTNDNPLFFWSSNAKRYMIQITPKNISLF